VPQESGEVVLEDERSGIAGHLENQSASIGGQQRPGRILVRRLAVQQAGA
jgi:hypothetical protein